MFLRPQELATSFTSPTAYLTAVCLVVFSTVLPYVFYTKGLAKVEAGKASIMASLEPVVASLVGVVVFSEPVSIVMLVGIALVLSGVAILG
ncbi:MAG: DMT family transporter, partial [Acidaminococcaceae bacterium]|nr:DMT family transporter [Acidaminococcaceae bacterium]